MVIIITAYEKEVIAVGIDLNLPILFKYSSFRYFGKQEFHVTRFCKENVLVMVTDGVLRFSENDEDYEVKAGEYFIQRKNCRQSAAYASDEPKYLYVHFDAEWTDGNGSLARRGTFDIEKVANLMQSIGETSFEGRSYTEEQYLLLKLLLAINEKEEKETPAKRMALYVEKNLCTVFSLSDLCDEFHYSKNYIIKLFKDNLGSSPFQYINRVKLGRAKHLLETSSKSLGEICKECGFSDYSYFYKRFIKDCGMSPLKWRKKVQTDPLLK